MRDMLLLVGGIAIGALAYRLLSAPSNCCDIIARAARSEAVEAAGQYGELVGAIGDVAGLWGLAPGAINLFGVDL